MRDSMKMTVRYQFIYMLIMQAAASGVCFVFGLVAFWYFMNISIAKEILSVVFMLVNFAMLYIQSKKFAVLDNKPYTPLKPSKLKGALFGCLIALANLIFMVIFRLLCQQTSFLTMKWSNLETAGFCIGTNSTRVTSCI